MAKEKRGGRVFVDWSQNNRHKTTIAPYSLRIRPRPWASTPLAWDEVTETYESGDGERLTFEGPDTVARIKELGDLYAPNLTLVQDIPAL
jgi:bifunctional non-homologous end joining protein LigD